MSRQTRRQALLELAERLGLGAVLLRTPANFAWYTGGADNRVDHSDPSGVAAVLVTPERGFILADNIEAPRMREEQTPGMEIVEYPWHEGPAKLLRDLTGDVAPGADAPVAETTYVPEEIAPLRYVLDGEALRSYRKIGADAASAVGEVAEDLDPDTDEREAAAGLVAACRRRGMFAPVVLAASARRLGRYRHPIPGGEKLGARAMLVVCAERGGLHANLTRLVDFEEPDAETRRRQAACDAVLRRMREEATRPGRTLSEAFADCQRFYAEEGHPDGWRDHHQGGLTGYASREVIATPDTDLRIAAGKAFAWNPSLVGAKGEETFVLLGSGPEVISS